MSRAGEEMMLELATILGHMEKTAGKIKGPGKPDGTGPNPECPLKEEDGKEKGKGKKKRKGKGKAKAFMRTIGNLVKLADSLDSLGATDASELVDNTLQSIASALKTAQPDLEFDEEEDITESFEEEEGVTGREEGMGTRVERTLQEPGIEDRDIAQPKQDETPEGLGMGDFNEGQIMVDKLDQKMKDPEFVAKLKALLEE